jgi:Acyl-CoA reductase (LuxC)
VLRGSSMAEPKISHLPRWVDPRDVEHVRVTGDRITCQLARPHLAAWPVVAEGLRAATVILRELKVTDLVAVIDTAARLWSDRNWPTRCATRDLVAVATGMAPETVDRSFDVELRNYRSEELWRALRRELGDPGVLDGPCTDALLPGMTMAVGPALICQVLTGNVPGLPALELVRALLVKSAVVLKVASSEPVFASRFVATLGRIEPVLADAVVVTYWSREDLAIRDAVLAEAEVVTAYGTDAACAAIGASTLPHQRFVAHGHKLSVGLLSGLFLENADFGALAALIARDASMFDQHACISAQAYLVEGDQGTVTRLAAAVADAMAGYAEDCPLGRGDPSASAGRRMRLADAEYRAAATPNRRVWAGADWTVVLDDALLPGSGDRMLRVVPVPSLERGLDMLRPFGNHLQNVAVGALDEQMPDLACALASLGATRICPPGRMPDPGLAWRHDGQTRIAELVRWSDIEMPPWGDSTSSAMAPQRAWNEGGTDATRAPSDKSVVSSQVTPR